MNKYREDILFLIRALNFFIEPSNIKIDAFEGLARDEIYSTTYFFIKSELSRYGDLTQEDFEKIDLTADVEALQEILAKRMDETIPAGLEEMVGELNDYIKKTEAPTNKEFEVDQSFEARLRRQLAYLKSQEVAASVFVSTTQIAIPVSTSERIKRLARENPNELREILSKNITTKDLEKVKDYVAYIAKSEKGQELPRLDPQTGDFSIGSDIQAAAKVIALPIVLSEINKKQYLIEEVKKNPQEFQTKLTEQLKESGASSEAISQVVNEYIQKINNLKPSDSLPIINVKSLTIEELPLSKVNLDEIVKPENFGSKTEIIRLASEKVIAAPILPVISSVEIKNSEILEKTNNVVTGIYGEQVARTIIPTSTEAKPSEAIGPTGFWAGPIGRTYIAAGIDEIAKSDPVTGTAMQLEHRYGINSRNFHEVRTRAIAMGVSLQQLDLLQSQLKTIDAANLDWIKVSLVGRSIGLDSATTSALFANQSINYQAVTAQRSPLGGVFYRGFQQIVGGRAQAFIEGSIRRGLTAAAEKTGGFVVKKAAGTAIGGLLARVGVIVGAIGGVVGAGITIAGGWLLSKAMIGVRKNTGKLLGATGLIGGFLVGGPIGAVVGGILGAAAAGINWKNVTKWAGIIIAAVLTAVFGAIAVPLAITFIGIPLLIVFILFIINSGAYIVPPGTGIGELASVSGLGQSITSPYIDIQKTAAPPGPFKNDQLGSGINVTYTIRIRPKKGALTNLRFQNKCQVIKKGNASCDHPTPEKEKDNVPDSLDPGKVFEYSYSQTYKSGFEDSLIIDTFTVTANAAEQPNAVAAGSASVIIGNPPTGCFAFAEGWPDQYKAMALQAIGFLTTNVPSYMARLCVGGNITLYPTGGGSGWAQVTGTRAIHFNTGSSNGLTNIRNAVYIIAHESGHIIQQNNKNIYRNYLDTSGVGNILICTYPLTNSSSESFPEMIADYVSDSPMSPGRPPGILNFSCLGKITFQQKYPSHWQFAHTYLINEQLGWPSVTTQ